MIIFAIIVFALPTITTKKSTEVTSIIYCFYNIRPFHSLLRIIAVNFLLFKLSLHKKREALSFRATSFSFVILDHFIICYLLWLLNFCSSNYRYKKGSTKIKMNAGAIEKINRYRNIEKLYKLFEF